MSETALIIRNDFSRSLQITGTAVALRDGALATAALIGKVTTPSENSEAAAAMVELRRVIKDIEAARVSCKAPVLDFSRQIDATAAEFVKELRAEEIRLATLAGNFQQSELAKRRAAEAAEKAELNRIEKEREAALAVATTDDERTAIVERANQEAEAARPAIIEVKAKGQIIKEDWDVEITNPFLLAAEHPELVRRIEFDMFKVKAALDVLEKLPGVRAKKGVSVGVRVPTGKVVDA